MTDLLQSCLLIVNLFFQVKTDCSQIFDSPHKQKTSKQHKYIRSLTARFHVWWICVACFVCEHHHWRKELSCSSSFQLRVFVQFTVTALVLLISLFAQISTLLFFLVQFKNFSFFFKMDPSSRQMICAVSQEADRFNAKPLLFASSGSVGRPLMLDIPIAKFPCSVHCLWSSLPMTLTSLIAVDCEVSLNDCKIPFCNLRVVILLLFSCNLKHCTSWSLSIRILSCCWQPLNV